EYLSQPAFANFPVGARCKPTDLDFGDFRLKLSVQEPTQSHDSQIMRGLAKLQDPLIRVVDDSLEADWLIQYDSLASGKLLLVRSEMSTKVPQDVDYAPAYSPLPSGDQML